LDAANEKSVKRKLRFPEPIHGIKLSTNIFSSLCDEKSWIFAEPSVAVLVAVQGMERE
jgi:hypothetical protein